uniref:Calpain catalytic domain-containing protein n=1 Tax=Macrostomum lignano TaxID=282301 RepID=A0A1I8F9T0_9PLAT
GENGHHASGYGRAAGQEALGGVVVASAVQEHLHQDQDACGAGSVFNGARIALGQGGPSVLHPASSSPVSALSDWPAMRGAARTAGKGSHDQCRKCERVRTPNSLELPKGGLGSEFNAPLRSKLSLAKASARHLQQTPQSSAWRPSPEKHTLLRASVILTCIGFVCYLQFPPLLYAASGKAHQAFGIIALLLFYALVVILVLYVFVEEASNYNILAFVCFVIAFVTAAFILLAAFVEPTLINQSATSWAGLGATCSALSGILLLTTQQATTLTAGHNPHTVTAGHRHSQQATTLTAGHRPQATGTQHTQKLLTSNERGDEEGNQHGQLLGFIHKDVGRHHDDGGNIEQVGQHRHGLAARAAQKKLVYSSRQKPITLKKKASFSHLLLEAENARHSRDDRADQAVRRPSWRPTAPPAKPSGCRAACWPRLTASAASAGPARPPWPACTATHNKCCNGVGGRNGNMMADAALMEALVDSHNTSADDFNREGSIDPTVETGSPIDDADFDEGDCGGEGGRRMKYPKHQDYCLCHKRKCKKCGCLCPCSEHACPGCGYSSRVVMTMRAVDGLKEIANAQKARFRNGRMATIGRCRPRGKRFLLGESGAGSPGGECSHAVMVRVGGGFVPLVEYPEVAQQGGAVQVHQRRRQRLPQPVAALLCRAAAQGPAEGIRYVDSVTQQLEELIFANREAGKTNCVCP